MKSNDRRDWGKKCLSAAIRRTMELLKKSNSPEALSAVAYYQAMEYHKKGRTEQACRKLETSYEWAKNIRYGLNRMIAIQQVATDLYLCGRPERAKEMIDGISDKLLHNMNWYYIAEGFIGLGDREQAIKTTALCPDPQLRLELYLKLAEKLHQKRKKQQALMAIDLALFELGGFKNAAQKMDGMLYAAQVMLKTGFIEKGLDLASRVLNLLPTLEPGLAKWKLLQRVAELHQKAGQGRKAVVLARKLMRLVVSERSATKAHSPENRAVKQYQTGHLLIRLADMLLLEGREDMALEVLRLADMVGAREHFCYLLACSAAEHGKTGLTEKLLDKISLLHLRLLVRLKQAEWEAKRKKSDTAAEIIIRVADDIQQLQPGRAEMILRTAAHTAFKYQLKGIDSSELMDRAFALGSTEIQNNGWQQNEYARYFARIGRIDRAVGLAEQIPDPINRLFTLKNIAMIHEEG